MEPATPDAASIGRTAQSAISAFNTFLSSVDNWGHMSDLQRVAALTNFYNGISVISGGSIPLPAPLVTGASLLNIATALESGNHASALASTLQVVDTLTQTAQTAGIVSATLGNQFLPGLNLALAINSGNPISIGTSALSLYAGNNPAAMAWIGPVGVFATIASLALAPQPPTVAGWSHVDLDPQGELNSRISHDQEGGGQVTDGAMSQLLQAFKQNLDRIVDDEGRPHFALNPARVPEVGYWHDPTGVQYQRQGASMLLRWVDARGETVTRFYDGAGNRADGSGENIAQDFARHAQEAIVPAWLLEGVMPRHAELVQAAAQLEAQVRALQLEADAIAPRIEQRLQTDLGPLVIPSPAPERHKALLPKIASLRDQAALQRAQAHQLLLSVPAMKDLGQKPTEHGDGTQSVEALTITVAPEPAGTTAEASEAQELRQVLMDLDGDGFLELTQWVRSNQALLGIDLNADGRLDGPELLSSDLRWLDANGDGRLDAQDPAFRAIRVWLDRNGDGQVQHQPRGADGAPLLSGQGQPVAESELKSLSQAGIAAINFGQGSVTATKIDGSTKPVKPTKVTGDTWGVRYKPGDKDTPGIIRIDEQPDGSGKEVVLPGNTGKPAPPRVAPPAAATPAAPHVNHNPVATDDVFAGLEDTPMEIAFEQLLINDWDEDTPRTGDVLRVTGVSAAVHGVVRMAPGHVIFEPAQDFFGQARFSYSISDGKGGSASATAFLNIKPVNDPPIIDSVTYDTAPNRWAWTHWDGDLYHYKDPTLASGRVFAHDIDSPGPLSYKIKAAPVHGHASIDASSGAWEYRAELIDPYVGEDPFWVQVSDPEGAASIATVHTRHEKDKVRLQDKQPIGWNPPKRQPDPDWFAPVVVDLQGDGLQLLDVREQPVLLDLDGDGLPERLGWVGPENALLALDRNGDGRVSLPEEISFVHDWPGASTDLEGLRAFDSNGDGWLSADDARWQDFGLFRDLNSNGVQDDGEFTPIGQTDIVAISLQREGAPEMVSGNLVWGTSQVRMADGSTRMAGDVMLRVWGEASQPLTATAEQAMLGRQVDQLVSVMASFAPPAAGQAGCAANDRMMVQPLWAVNGGERH
ncbi:Ig-like domain-containing protein [Ottowia caeni]|uniref:Ig-like domain-containing protein n=1 Tax=Ottowia caeni TaxID=2870339 RepID=UPI003D726676